MPVHLCVWRWVYPIDNLSSEGTLSSYWFHLWGFPSGIHSLQIFHNWAQVVKVLSQRAPIIHSFLLVNLRIPKNVCCSEQNLWLLQIIPGLEEVLAGMKLGGSFIPSSKENMFMPSSWIMLHAELVCNHNYVWSYVWLSHLYISRKEESLDSTRGWLHWCTPWTPAKRGKLVFWHTWEGISQSMVIGLWTSQGNWMLIVTSVLAVWTSKSPDVTCQGAPRVRGAIVED